MYALRVYFLGRLTLNHEFASSKQCDCARHLSAVRSGCIGQFINEWTFCDRLHMMYIGYWQLVHGINSVYTTL